MAADNAYRAKAWECLSLAERTNDPEERADIVRFAWMWMSLAEPIDEARDHNSAIPIAFCSFGSIVGSLPSSARLQFSGQRRSSLAPRGVPVVLARAVTQAGWQAKNFGRSAQSHRCDEPVQTTSGVHHTFMVNCSSSVSQSRSQRSHAICTGVGRHRRAGGPF
jgi:hypothetical protein